MNICSSTDAALAWLLSLSATCTSSPFRPSSPADCSHSNSFTDWLQISPSSSPTRPSSPLQDVSSSFRVNPPQEQNGDIFLHYDNGFRDIFNSTHPRSHQSDSTLSTSDTTQDRMFFLDSSSTTFDNSPSPRSLAFLSPSTSQEYYTASLQPSPLNPPMFASPASKLINELTNSPFGSYLNLYDPTVALPSLSFSDVSPVVRASHKAEEPLPIDKEREVSKKRKKKSKTRDSKNASSSFLERLQAVPPHPSTIQQQRSASHRPLSADLLDGSSAGNLVLLSPVKLPGPPALSQITLDTSDSMSPPPEPCPIPAPVFATPPRPAAPTNTFFSPLSPLTPLSSPEPPLKIKIVLKRKNTDPTTPTRRTKRPRRTHTVAADPALPIEDQGTNDPSASDHEAEPSQDENPRPPYTQRTLPTDIEISSAFPLLYRRFPASTYYRPPDADSPCTLFGVTHPGGNYNPPRRVFDLYTPRFVKGRGAEKVGLCPICVEPVNRGGENKRLWHAMKFSAFNYHMQYAHGVSASTGKPFSPPTAFRVVPRQNVGKNEKHHIQQGKCHKCSKWIIVEGIKDMESKVPELYWWKHAATCHHDSTLRGEGDYFEQDDVYAKLISFEQPSDAC